MTEEEKNAVEFVKKRTKELKKYAKRENELVYDDIILNLIDKLQKENENFEKLNKDYSYSVDIVRENTRLRRQTFDLELENKKLKNTDLKQAKIEYLEVLNEKLQKENTELKEKRKNREPVLINERMYFIDNEIYNDLLEDIKSNYISVQKIKDIIDRIDYDIKKTKEIISKNRNIFASYRKNDYQIVRLRAMNTKSLDIKKRLQKLLESEE